MPFLVVAVVFAIGVMMFMSDTRSNGLHKAIGGVPPSATTGQAQVRAPTPNRDIALDGGRGSGPVGLTR